MKSLSILLPALLFLLASNLNAQWQTFQTPTYNSHYWDVSVVNQNIVWVGGSNAGVRRTTNGGVTWDIANYGLTSLNIYHISAIDQNRAWITCSMQGDGERVFSTTNGGLNWNEQFYNLPFWIDGIHFFNSSTGIFLRDPIYPSSGRDTTGFFITRNGGLNWYLTPNFPRSTWLCDGCLGALDTNLVWFVDDNKLYKLQGGLNNIWQVYTIASGAYCYQALYRDYSTGLTTDGIKIYKTTNGGVNWFVFNNEAISYGSMSFINVRNTEWVIINSGHAVRISYNFCNTWQPIVTLPDSLWTYYMDAYDTNSIWIAASKGRLLKYNYDYIGISSNNNEIPREFILYQNYPNPFNPTTVIKYDLPIEGEVVFKVYDVLGREVYSLAEYKKTGSHEIDFDGTTYSSGLYFYKIECDKFSDVKKMLLIK